MKTLKILFLLFVFLTGTITSSQGQTNSFKNIKRAYLQSTKALTINGEVKGYYTFWFLEKVNKKENSYMLTLMDENLETTQELELVKDKNYILLESAYNGSTFCFSFINYKLKVVEYNMYDMKGKATGTYTTEKLSNMELQYMASLVATEDDVYSGGLMPIADKGFIRYGMEKGDGWRYTIEMITNKGKKTWETNSGNEDGKAYESASPMYSNGTTLVSLVSTRKGMMSKNMDAYCVFTNTTNGDELFRTEAGSSNDKKYVFQPIGINFDESVNEYFLYGEYFNDGDKIMKDKSQGFYFQNISKSGALIKESFASWTKDIAAKLPVNENGKMDKNMSIAIHNMVRTADGKLFAIGEQFKKSVSAGGVALNILAAANGQSGGSDAAIMKIEIHDMVVLEFDENMEIEKAKVFAKATQNVYLPKGYGSLSTPMLGYILKSRGLFDYNFTSMSADRTTFHCAYTNYDRNKAENSNYVIGNISYTGDKLEFEKIRLSKKPTTFLVMPAKPGYLAILEYFSKEKKIDIRLHELTQ